MTTVADQRISRQRYLLRREISRLTADNEALRALLVRASVSMEPFAEIGSMLSLAGATEADEVELSGEQLRPALIAAKAVKVEIDAALREKDDG